MAAVDFVTVLVVVVDDVVVVDFVTVAVDVDADYF